ncbi:uncharacterized protein LOC117186190 [Drosophila miranda]|uniref:uncharacterized protein LOC117186190 n=1 Tax=Drosophila miranda TaxID=7229 RepID=UPI00143F1355|nr:uncharacterized protein LOC117186190 [Drosophila miranda]
MPSMLICLSNIGDVMATSFRFLYWRICCYVCTRTAKRPRNACSRQRSVRGQRYARSQPPPSFRRSMKMTQRSGNDSGFGPSMGHAHSDPELRIMGRGVGGGYDDREFGHRCSGGRNRRQQQIAAQPRQQRHNIYGDEYEMQTQTLNRGNRYSSRQRQRDRMRDRHTVERERYRHDFDAGSMEDFSDLQPPAKRAASVRSVRSPQHQESKASRELHRLHSAPGRGARAKSVDPRTLVALAACDVNPHAMATTWSSPTTMLRHRGPPGIIAGTDEDALRAATRIMWGRASMRCPCATAATTRTIPPSIASPGVASRPGIIVGGSGPSVCLPRRVSCRPWVSLSSGRSDVVPATNTTKTTPCMGRTMGTMAISCPRTVLCPSGCASSWSSATSWGAPPCLPTGRTGPFWTRPTSASSR